MKISYIEKIEDNLRFFLLKLLFLKKTIYKKKIENKSDDVSFKTLSFF